MEIIGRLCPADLQLMMFPGVAEASVASEWADGCTYTAGAALNPSPHIKNVIRDAKDFEQFPDKSKLPQKVFTWEELEWYNGEQGRPMYLVADNNVYDFTTFADLHPGGPAPLKKHAGHDATVALQSCKMTQTFEVFLQRFKVGCVDKPKKEKLEVRKLV